MYTYGLYFTITISTCKFIVLNCNGLTVIPEERQNKCLAGNIDASHFLNFPDLTMQQT